MVITLRLIFFVFLLFFGSSFFYFVFSLVHNFKRFPIEELFPLIDCCLLSSSAFTVLLAVGAWLHSTAIF